MSWRKSTSIVALALRIETSQRQLTPLARGTSSSRQRMDERDLLGVMIPYPHESAVRKSVADQFREALVQAREACALNLAALRVLEDHARRS